MMRTVICDGTTCRVPDNMDVSLYAVEPDDPQDVQPDPAFLARLEASAMITQLAHSDADQSVARMVQYDRLRAKLGVW